MLPGPFIKTFFSIAFIHSERGEAPMEQIPLTNDIIFKSVFGRDTNTHILMPLLNSVLGFTEEDRIEKAEILNPYRYGDKVKDKTVVLDIATTDSQGRHYNIEMQVNRDVKFIPRVLFYLDSLYISQLAGGVDFGHLRKTIGISFVDFLIFPDYSRIHSRFCYKEWNDNDTLTDIKELHFLELSKFHGESVESLSTSLDRWLHLLKFSPKYANIEIEIPAELSAEEGIEMAINAYRKSLADRKVQNMIHFREKAEGMTAAEISVAREEARAEGLAEGEARGEAKGELKKSIEFARKLFQRAMDKEEVKSLTGLSDEQLAQLNGN